MKRTQDGTLLTPGRGRTATSPLLILVTCVLAGALACGDETTSTTSGGTGSGGTSAGSTGGSSTGGTPPKPPPVLDAGTSSPFGTHCPSGMSRCGEADFCCPTGDACLANPNNQYGCGAGFCCFSGCASGNFCGAGCCDLGQVCTSGGSCGLSLCCTDQPDPPCPSATAANCPSGTTCVFNHSSRACGGDFACYTPAGAVACPGEIVCPNGADFCPAGTECDGINGVCLAGSEGGNYCCKPVVGIGQSCDNADCQRGSTCVANNQCDGSDPSATKVCYGPCGTDFPVDCGNYCCASETPTCAGGCYCNP